MKYHVSEKSYNIKFVRCVLSYLVGLHQCGKSEKVGINIYLSRSLFASSPRPGRCELINYPHCTVKPRPHQQQRRSNIVECYKSNDSVDKVECCFDIAATFSNVCWLVRFFAGRSPAYFGPQLWDLYICPVRQPRERRGIGVCVCGVCGVYACCVG